MQRLHRRLQTSRRLARELWRLPRSQLTTMTPLKASSSIVRTCDAHCHLHDERFRQELFEDPNDARGPASDRLDAVIQRAAAAGVTHAVSCACHKEDWGVLELLLSVQQAAKQRAAAGGDQEPQLEIVPCFGLHPWWAQQHAGGEDTTEESSDGASLLSSLRDLLLRYPSAGVGVSLVVGRLCRAI